MCFMTQILLTKKFAKKASMRFSFPFGLEQYLLQETFIYYIRTLKFKTMTKEEAENLVAEARPRLNQNVTIQNIEYTFTDVSSISCNGEDDNLVCKVNGKLLDSNNKEIIYPLSLIMKSFG